MNFQKKLIKSHYNGKSTNFDLLEIQEPVRWMGPFLNYSGFAGEMLNFLIPLLMSKIPPNFAGLFLEVTRFEGDFQDVTVGIVKFAAIGTTVGGGDGDI